LFRTSVHPIAAYAIYSFIAVLWIASGREGVAQVLIVQFPKKVDFGQKSSRVKRINMWYDQNYRLVSVFSLGTLSQPGDALIAQPEKDGLPLLKGFHFIVCV
jgi:hypothetical protein